MRKGEKIKAILQLITPKSITNTRSFHGFGSFYRRFMKDFSIGTAPLIELSQS